MKHKYKAAIIFVFIVILLLPVNSRYGKRPHMSHKTFEAKFLPLAQGIETYGDSFLDDINTKWLSLNYNLQTGIHGKSIIGADIHIGRSSQYVMSRIREKDAECFFREGDRIWISESDLERLNQLINKSEPVN